MHSCNWCESFFIGCASKHLHNGVLFNFIGFMTFVSPLKNFINKFFY